MSNTFKEKLKQLYTEGTLSKASQLMSYSDIDLGKQKTVASAVANLKNDDAKLLKQLANNADKASKIIKAIPGSIKDPEMKKKIALVAAQESKSLDERKKNLDEQSKQIVDEIKAVSKAISAKKDVKPVETDDSLMESEDDPDTVYNKILELSEKINNYKKAYESYKNIPQ